MGLPIFMQDRRQRDHTEQPAKKDNLENMDVVTDMTHDGELRSDQQRREARPIGALDNRWPPLDDARTFNG